MNARKFENFYVQGEHVMRPDFPADKSVGQFSSHWAAVAALVRLRDNPGFRSLGGDKEEDLIDEQAMRTHLSMQMMSEFLGA